MANAYLAVAGDVGQSNFVRRHTRAQKSTIGAAAVDGHPGDATTSTRGVQPSFHSSIGGNR